MSRVPCFTELPKGGKGPCVRSAKDRTYPMQVRLERDAALRGSFCRMCNRARRYALKLLLQGLVRLRRMPHGRRDSYMTHDSRCELNCCNISSTTGILQILRAAVVRTGTESRRATTYSVRYHNVKGHLSTNDSSVSTTGLSWCPFRVQGYEAQ